jgi:hypothetical protein
MEIWAQALRPSKGMSDDELLAQCRRLRAEAQRMGLLLDKPVTNPA